MAAPCQAPVPVCEALDLIIPLQIGQQGHVFRTGYLLSEGHRLQMIMPQNGAGEIPIYAHVSGRLLETRLLRQDPVSGLHQRSVDISDEMPPRQWGQAKKDEEIYIIGGQQQGQSLVAAVLSRGRVVELTEDKRFFTVFSYPTPIWPGSVVLRGDGTYLGQIYAGDAGWYSVTNIRKSDPQGQKKSQACQAVLSKPLDQSLIQQCLTAGVWGEQQIWARLQQLNASDLTFFQQSPTQILPLLQGRALKMGYITAMARYAPQAQLKPLLQQTESYWQQAPYGPMIALTAALRQGNKTDIQKSFDLTGLGETGRGQAWRQQLKVILTQPGPGYPYQWLWQGFSQMPDSFLRNIFLSK